MSPAPSGWTRSVCQRLSNQYKRPSAAAALNAGAPSRISSAPLPKQQHVWGMVVEEERHGRFLDKVKSLSTDTLDQRAYRDAVIATGDDAHGGRITGLWVHAPGHAYGCSMSDMVLQAALRARLGFGVRDVPDNPSCACGHAADRSGMRGAGARAWASSTLLDALTRSARRRAWWDPLAMTDQRLCRFRGDRPYFL